jgi:hypothetical protein
MAYFGKSYFGPTYFGETYIGSKAPESESKPKVIELFLDIRVNINHEFRVEVGRMERMGQSHIYKYKVRTTHYAY